MALKYKEALKRNNITEADMLNAAKKRYNDLIALQDGLAKLKEKYETADDDEKSVIEEKIEKLQDAIYQIDEELVKKIDKHHYFVEQAKKLKAGRGKNKNEQSDAQSSVQQTEVQQTEVQQTEVQQTEVQQTEVVNEQKPSAEIINEDQTTTNIEVTEEREKKKSSTGWGGIILGITLLALTAGAVNYFRNKD